jgi:hypothetical protein
VLVLRVYLINEKIGLEPKPNPPLALVPEQLKRLPNRRQSSKYELTMLKEIPRSSFDLDSVLQV